MTKIAYVPDETHLIGKQITSICTTINSGMGTKALYGKKFMNSSGKKLNFKFDSSTPEELEAYNKLQSDFTASYEQCFSDDHAKKTIIVIPSLTLDQEVLEKVNGSIFYEERLLCLLMLLRMPRTHVIYLSSIPIDPIIIDYYLHLLPGITGYHARERLTLLSCYDSSPVSLTEKILQRPRLMERIKKRIPAGYAAHLACFNTTPYEKILAIKLGLPVYGCDPQLNYWGTKSGSRRIFLLSGVTMPPGVEDLKSYEEIVHAAAALKDMYPGLKKAVLKLNDGFSGEGNAILTYPEKLERTELFNWIHDNLYKKIVPVAKDLSIDVFLEKFMEMEGVIEAFIEGESKFSPSVQCRINPLGKVDIISTHDQELNNQVFVGAYFPADEAYRTEVAEIGKQVAGTLQKKGVMGRFSIDFISVKGEEGWKHYAIEINLRKGGTTHPFLMLQFVTNGKYDEEKGVFEMPNKQLRYYFASDNLQSESYKGLSPQDLIDIAMFHGLHYDGADQKGVMFHMIGALSQYGKMGIVCIGESREEAICYYKKTLEVLDKETRNFEFDKNI